MLTSEVLEYTSRSVLCWLATVDETGQPNVSPKEIFAAFDSQHIVVANIASPTSERNIEVNSRVCISFVDIFVQKGFKVIGTARNIRRSDADFSKWSTPLEAMAGAKFPIRSVFVIQAVSVETIIAPSYRLYTAETTEKSQVASAMQTYGVQRSSDV